MFEVQIFTKVMGRTTINKLPHPPIGERPLGRRKNCLDRLFHRLLLETDKPMTPEEERQADELLNNSLRLQQPVGDFSVLAKDLSIFSHAILVHIPDNEIDEPKKWEEDETMPSDESEESMDESSLMMEEELEKDIEKLLWDEYDN